MRAQTRTRYLKLLLDFRALLISRLKLLKPGLERVNLLLDYLT